MNIEDHAYMRNFVMGIIQEFEDSLQHLKLFPLRVHYPTGRVPLSREAELQITIFRNGETADIAGVVELFVVDGSGREISEEDIAADLREEIGAIIENARRETPERLL